jgi:hypothetical protein
MGIAHADFEKYKRQYQEVSMWQKQKKVEKERRDKAEIEREKN